MVPPGAVDEGIDFGRRRSSRDAAAETRTASWRPTSWAPRAWTSCAGARGGCSACRRKRSAEEGTSPWKRRAVGRLDRREAEKLGRLRKATAGEQRSWVDCGRRRRGSTEQRKFARGEGKGRALDLSSRTGSRSGPATRFRVRPEVGSCREGRVEVD